MKHLLLLVALCCGCHSVASLRDELTAPRLPFEVTIDGNQAFDDASLVRAIAFELSEYDQEGRSRAAADDAAFALEVTYRSRGYREAQVDYAVESQGGLHFTIQEGPRTIIDEENLRIEGVRAFSRDEVLAFFNGPRLGLLGRGALLYIEERVRSVPSALLREYGFRGYLDAKVAPVEEHFPGDGTRAELSLSVQEGPRYSVGRILFEGDTSDLNEEFLRNVRSQFQGSPESPRTFTPHLPFELRGQLREHLRGLGYPEPRVEVLSKRTEDAHVDLRVTIAPGPRVTLGEIRFEGNDITRPGFLASRLLVHPGQRYDERALSESLRRLYRTGLFQSVDSRLESEESAHSEQPDSAVRDLVIHVEEAPTREYFIEPGYGSYELFRLRAGVREKNIFGSGRRLSAEGTIAVRALRGSLTLTDPWLWGSDLTGDLPLEFDERRNPSFASRSLGVGAFVTHTWAAEARVTTTVGYQFRRSEVFDVEVIDSDVLAALDNLDLSTLKLSHTFDALDNVLMPTRGTAARASLEWGDRSVGSDLDFLRGELSLRHYRHLGGDELVLATALRAGVIIPRGDAQEIPLQERFFNGGENTVRAFFQDDLGPEDAEGNPIGGEGRMILNLELQRRLGRSWELALFADAGSVTARAADWLDLGALRVGYGVGLRHRLPIGPIRLDLGWNPDPHGDEDSLVLHLAMGIAF